MNHGQPLTSPAAIPGDRFDVAVIGGGAAGLFCAAEAAQRGLSVVVLEHANKVGKKILMSGGGRCNFTHLHASPDNYRSQNPHFCRSALAGFSPYEFLSRVEAAGIGWVEKSPGQLFCAKSAKDLLAMLLTDCEQAGVQIAVNAAVEVTTLQAPFTLRTGSRQLSAGKLVIATGGLSIPKMGASGFGLDLARAAGHAIIPTRAGLVPFTLTGRPAEEFCDLAGISTPVTLQAGAASYTDALLITHRGLSGPAVLQASSHWNAGDAITINWLPGAQLDDLLTAKGSHRQLSLHKWLSQQLPDRLAQRLVERSGGDCNLQQSSNATLAQRLQALQSWSLKPSGTEGYRTAEVTEGGIATDEVSSKTLESRRVSGLHFIGEVLDVTGELGGYNFQWAWASAMACARAL